MRCVDCVDSRIGQSPAGGTGIDHLPSNGVLDAARGENPKAFEVRDRDTAVSVLSKKVGDEMKAVRHVVFLSCTWTPDEASENFIRCSMAGLMVLDVYPRPEEESRGCCRSAVA